tara:strand:+ start:209 stop:340 length:132 start_codon:yes stop_codon:yes gene_type:complete
LKAVIGFACLMKKIYNNNKIIELIAKEISVPVFSIFFYQHEEK